MKRYKILLCGLLAGLSISSYLIVTRKSSTTELFLLNVEALSQDESAHHNRVYANGFCTTNTGGIIRGMKFVE